MTRSSLTVIKVGGSLFDWAEFPPRMASFLGARKALDRDARLVLIAGGGQAVDVLRVLDRVHGLGDQTAHRLALHAMDLTSLILAALVPGAVAVDDNNGLRAAWSTGAIPVLAPRCLIDQAERSSEDALPASWDVTSDTIAAWIALHLTADRLVLLKSAPLPVGADRDQAARLGLVDPVLPIVARALPWVEYVNLREQSPQPRLLSP